MASSDKDASCANEPDFAVICSFLEKFSGQLQVEYPDFKQLQDWLTNTDEVPNGLRDLHVKLMRKTRRTVHECAWETALSKFCFSYSSQDGWEIERFGYKKSSLKVKLRIMRELLENQFDRNNKFRAQVLNMSAEWLRTEPIGRDRLGHSYWLTQDLDCNLRIYQEHLDEEIWQVVATNRDELVKLITRLKGNEVVLPSVIGDVDEDSSSNSCSAGLVKPPPPEEKDDSQESNQSTEGRIPNIKIKLGSKENGVVVNSDSPARVIDETPHENEAAPKEEKKVKPLVISQAKITMERSKKRSLDEADKVEPEEVKKHRPSLLDSKREKKLSKYEKAKQQDDEDEQNDDDGDEECDEEEEEDSADEGEEEEDVEEEAEGEEDADGEEDAEGEDDVNGEEDVDGEDEVDGEDDVDGNVELEEDDGEDFEEADDADDAEEDDDDEDDVGEEIEDPPLIVSEDGSGKECDSGYNHFLAFAGLSDEPEFSEVIEETTLHVFGEGAGAECLVGNAKASEPEPKATFFFGQPGCLKLSPVKTQTKVEDGENHNDKKEEEDTKSTPEPANGENHTAEVEEKESETTKEEAPGKFAEIPEPNNDTQSPKPTTRPSIINRKRRLSEDKPEKHIRHSSESETDINSEVADDQLPESDEPEDIGGKRIKMRTKIMNADVRKKVEAQRQVAAVEETTSSSSEEERPRKKCSPKKIERDPEPHILPLKAKLKQAAVAARAMEQQEEEEKKCPSPKQPEEVEPEEAKVEVKKDDPDEKKPELEVVDEESPEQAVTTSPPPKDAVDVKEEPELANESHVSPAKHNKKSHPVESSEEADEEVPKKKQSPEPSPRPSPDKTDLKKTECEERTPEKLAPKSPEPAPDEHQSVVENQRKRRSSEDDSVAKQPTPPKSTVAPSVPVKTRTGRRGGPPEPVPELPQIKRTRLKPSERAAKPDVKKTTPTKAETAPKAKTPARAVPTKAAVKQEAPKEEPIDLKEEQPEPEQKEVKTEEVKEEEEVKTEDEPAATPTKTPPKSTVVQRPRQQAAQKQPATVHRRKTHDAVDAKNIIDVDEATPVRQSRRIAQLKIREEAERRKMEEIALRNMKAELKKKKKAEKAVDDPTVSEPSEHSSDHAESAGEVEVKKKAEKKKKCPGKGGWSSGSEEPEEEEEEQYETDPGSPLFRSDHEFSPESELEDESQVVPLKRARTARKEGEEVVPTAVTDESCQKCGKSDHPEWILLCDKCDKGYHCSCLSPVIFYIPEGDWFCPPCQQEELIAALENHLKDFDNLVQSKKEEEEERLRLEMQERLELEQAELEKLEKKTKRRQVRKKKGNAGGGRHRTYRRKMMSDDSADESDDNETETDASNSSRSNSTRGRSTRSQSESPTDSDDEPIYKLRKRRQINVSYRLNEYDDMIKSALKEEEDEVAGAGNLGRGKDISTIIEADKEEKLRQQQLRIAEENGEAVEEPEKTAANPAAPEDSGSDFEPLKRKPKGGRHLKKKSRKLTTLDISSEGDNDSDEDFKTSSMDDDDEDEEDDDDAQSSDSSLDVYRRRGRGGKNKKKTRRAARRSARERRKDRRFIVDDSDGSDDEERPRLKKKRKKDSDYTETETNDDDDDELSENIDSDDLCDDSTESEASDGAWRPSKRKKQRSSTIARKSPKLKPKSASRPKKTKRVDDNNRSFKSGISKNRAIRDDSDDDDDDADSVDSSRRTRGKRCTYLEDYEDESSDGGIKPGVKRPDTPPEEREQFIKKQEEIKRMLAEKNAEGAKLAATPRLIPIKAGAQRSPAKLDPLSTVPLSVIRQAKVLDIDYLQRKGESISEEDLEESEFDEDDLPDDFNPEDMDEEAIARMVEEEDFAQQQLKLPPPAEVLRKKPSKELDTVLKQVPSFMGPQPQQSTSSSSSGLQEPVRKKLPMPTMHPPLLRHGFGAPSQQMLQQHRSSAPPHLPLLQNALSAPQHNPMSRSFPPASQAIPATTAGMGPQPPGGSGSFAGGDPNKPRGRRKKITPLRDPLQKQQAAAAASAAAAAASKPRVDNMPAGKTEAKSPTIPVASPVVATPGVIKSALSIAQPPQLYKPPPANTQPSVITRMPHVQGRPIMPVNGPPYADQGPRFYRQPQPQPQPQQQQQQPPQPPGNVLIAGGRPPMRHRGPPMPPLPAHHSLRPSYVGGPPPLRPSSNAPPMSLPNDVRDQVQQRQSASYPGSDQQYTPPPARHSAPPHLSPYRPQMFGNPGFPQRGPPTNSSQPSAIRTAGAPPEYASPGSFVGVGGYNYYPPPLSVPHSAPPPPTASAVPSSVIVSASSLAAASSSASSAAAAAAAAASIPPQPPPTSAAAAPSRPPPPAPSPLTTDKPSVPATAPGVSTKAATPSVIELSRKKLTTLETFNTSKTVTPPPPLTESSESRSPYSSNPPTVGGVDDVPDDGSGSPPASSQTTSEFSGLVSYFSSQHDDLNT